MNVFRINVGYVLNTHSCYYAVLSNEGDTQQRKCLRAQTAHPVEVITKVRVHTQNTHPKHTHRRTGMLPRSLLRAGLAALCDRQSGVMGSPGQAVAGV